MREFLSEHVYTCFFTNFYFEHNGAKLNEYTELAELDLQSNAKIFMRPDKYDEKAARTHIKRLVDILEKAPVLTNSVAVAQQGATKESPVKTRSRSSSMASNEPKDAVVDASKEEQT